MFDFDFTSIDTDKANRTLNNLLKERQNAENKTTVTTIEQVIISDKTQLFINNFKRIAIFLMYVIFQEKVENDILNLYKLNKQPLLARHNHVAYLKRSLTHLATVYEVSIIYLN